MAGERSRDNGGRRDMAPTNYTLVIGDKNISSWSLRPWVALKACGIPFAEERVRLRQPDSKAEILRNSPSGKVPALKTEKGVVWDSLAILEYLAEHDPQHHLWPKERRGPCRRPLDLGRDAFGLRRASQRDAHGPTRTPGVPLGE